MEKIKPVVLIICDYYLPGFESGGTTRTIVNMVERLGEDYDFRIITRDHDGPLNRTPYSTVQLDSWNQVGQANVYYLSNKSIRIGTIRRLIRETRPSIIYLNSLFSRLSQFTILLNRYGGRGAVPIVLAPEGELVPGGLRIKPLKKTLYLNATKLLKLMDDVVWKAASEFERSNIENVYGKERRILIAPNMPPRRILEEFDPNKKPAKSRGIAKMVFLSRISQKKNLEWLLHRLCDVRGDLALDIYGPIEDGDYWTRCRAEMSSLPANISAEYKGTVAHENVAETLVGYHFFVLPTLGENFGHIFVEALAAGCPLIASDRTPWRHLETDGIGWDIPLEDPEKWSSVFHACLELTDQQFRAMSESARSFAVSWLSDPEIEKANRAVLEFPLSRK